jgi:hypothetical protein
MAWPTGKLYGYCGRWHCVFRYQGPKIIGVSNYYIKEKIPPANTGLSEGELAWRQHDGGHTDAPNFQYFIPWANKLLKYSSTPAK